MENVFVTGGAGFIGSHLCDRLVEEGHKVICVDSYVTGSYENTLHLWKTGLFETWGGDIRELKDYSGSLMFNLACPASPKKYMADPIGVMLTNVVGTNNLLRSAYKYKMVFVQASTSEVYGDPLEHPQKEYHFGNVNTIGPRACYDEGKRAAETLCRDYAVTKNVDVRIARIFNTYGPRMSVDDGRVVSNFIVSALNNNPLVIYGDGSQTRSFCYVTDTVDALLRLSKCDPNHIPVNIGNPTEIVILELAETILKMTKSRSRIVFEKALEDDPRRRRPDIQRAHSKMGWFPKVDLEEGLDRTISYFRGNVT